MPSGHNCFESLSVKQQERLSLLLEEYFVALERGRPISAGEFVARHPDLAEPLRIHLQSLDFLQDAAAGFRGGPAARNDDCQGQQEQQTLGDFQIEREIGRGGMGVVYAARQVSLNRRVALKVLPFAALLDGRQIARFRNEAQAAAQLRHPNIVPVFAIGDHQGAHFYAMQLIRGQPLDAVISTLRDRAPRFSGQRRSGVTRKGVDDPTRRDETNGLCKTFAENELSYFRAVAECMIQAAEALHSAHEAGIVHRDVKPSNLLLDDAGKLWVTDFGLASFRSQGDLTRSGEFVGTLRYMSPEQARGEKHDVNHRSDVYSLGVTMYELLTLQHPIRGTQPAAMLQHLDRTSPYRLRVWNSRIPVDLESIAQKAMAASPEHRYASAQHLSDDLKRFLRGQPTVARQATAWRRVGKWMKRNKLATSFVSVLILSVVGLAVITGLLIRERRQTEQALDVAADHQRRYRGQLALSDNHLALMHDQRGEVDTAEIAFRRAAKQQRGLLKEYPDDLQTSRELIATLNNLGFFYARHGRGEAAECYREALSLLQGMAVRYPANSQVQFDLALTYGNLGSFRAKQKQPRRALAANRTAVNILEDCRSKTGGGSCLERLGVAYNNLGVAHDAVGEPDAAIRCLQKALQVLAVRTDARSITAVDASRWAGIYSNLGSVQERQERWQRAAACYAEAVSYQTIAAEKAPRVKRYSDLLQKHRANHRRVQNRFVTTAALN